MADKHPLSEAFPCQRFRGGKTAHTYEMPFFVHLEKTGYSRVDIDTDRRTAKTFYTYRGGLHINGTGNLSFHILPPQDSLGLGRFAICATRNGESSQLGTDQAPFFFGRLLAFLKGERKENEIIDEISTDRKTE